MICDFGCSRLLNASRSLAEVTTTTKGTQQYWAPELIDGVDINAKQSKATDVWSFGMTALEVLTNQVPYKTSCFHDAYVIIKIRNRDLPKRPTVQTRNGEVALSTEIWETIESCWRENPNDRPKASILQQQFMKSAQEITSVEAL